MIVHVVFYLALEWLTVVMALYPSGDLPRRISVLRIPTSLLRLQLVHPPPALEQ